MSDLSPPRQYGYLNAIGIVTLIRRELKREVRFFGISVVGPALQALLFAGVILITLGGSIPQTGGLDYITFLSTGFIATSMLQRSFESTAFSLMFDKLEGNLDDLLGAPLNGIEILVSYTISASGLCLAIGTSVWAVLILLGGPVIPIHIPELVCGVLLGIFLFSSAGVSAAIISEKWDKLAGLEAFVLMPLMFLSGSFFPRSALDADLQFLLDYNPVFRIVEAVRFGFTGAHALDIWQGLILVAIWVTISWGITLIFLTTGYKIKN